MLGHIEDEAQDPCGAALLCHKQQREKMVPLHVTPSWEYRNRPWYENKPLTSTIQFSFVSPIEHIFGTPHTSSRRTENTYTYLFNSFAFKSYHFKFKP